MGIHGFTTEMERILFKIFLDLLFDVSQAPSSDKFQSYEKFLLFWCYFEPGKYFGDGVSAH